MDHQGNLRHHDVASILQSLSRGGLTGSLHLVHQQKKACLVLREGKAIYSFEDDQAPQLVRILIRQDLVQPKDLWQFAYNSATPQMQKSLGALLTQESLVQPEDLKQTVLTQLRERVWDLFLWTVGSYEFRQTAPSGSAIAALELDLAPILEEHARRQPAIQAMLARLPSENTILVSNPMDKEKIGRPALNKTEWHVLSLANGRTTVASLLSRSCWNRLMTCFALDSLLAKGILSPAGKSVKAAEPRQAVSSFAAKEKETPPPLLKWLESVARRIEPEKEVPYPSPVALTAQFINEHLERLAAMRTVSGSLSDGLRVELRWLEALEKHPRADLVVVQSGRLRTERFDAFLRKGGLSPAMRPVYDDTLAALLDVLEWFHARAEELVGARNAQRLRQELIQSFSEHSKTEIDPSFDLPARLHRSAVA